MMKIVAQHLNNHAIANSTDSSAVLFVKSACNRYYYHTFLGVRQEVRCLLPANSKFPHGADAGRVLNKPYGHKISQRLKENGLHDKADELVALIKQLSSKFSNLYAIRQQADYEDLIVKFPTNRAVIAYHRDNNKNQTLTEIDIRHIESDVDEIMRIVLELKKYRVMAGF